MHECNVENCDRPDLTPEEIATINNAFALVVERGLISRGSFAQYLDDED